MAYRRDLSLFKRGLIRWNEWREENPKVVPDLSGVDRSEQDYSGFNLSLADLRGSNLSRANLSRANLNRANLSRSDLSWANLSEANLKSADLSGADLSGADFRGASLINIILNEADLQESNLAEICLSGTNLSGVNFSRANLKGADLEGANLSFSDLSGASLSGANLRNANLVKANLKGSDLNGTNLEGANLNRTVLEEAELKGAMLKSAILRSANLSLTDLDIADLSEASLDLANFSGANLSKADLSRTQALGTNFTGSKLTGACLENWNINNSTNLDSVVCDYVYLRSNEQERRPSSGNFASGEFTKLFQKTLETVDLIFRNGIDWDAFAYSFKKVEVENQGAQLDVQSIEKKGDSVLVVRVSVSPDANKAKIHGDFVQGYEFARKVLEEQYQAERRAKDALIAHQEAQIVRYEGQINRLFDIVEQSGSVQKALAENPRKVSNYDLRYSQLAGGIVNAEKVQSHQIGGEIHNSYNQELPN